MTATDESHREAWGPIVLIVGPPRSGTTLLAGLLSAHDNAVPLLPECSVLTSLWRQFYEHVSFMDAERFEFYYGTRAFAQRVFQAPVDIIIDNIHRRYNPDRNLLVLKDPNLVHYVPIALDMLPDDTKVICCIRDPRDVIASLIEVRRREGAPDDMTAAIALIFEYYYSAYKIQQDPAVKTRVAVVRYEDIVARTEAFHATIETHCGIDLRAAGAGRYSYAFDAGSSYYSSDYGGAVTGSRLGRHTSVLGAADIAAVEAAFAGVMQLYGYS